MTSGRVGRGRASWGAIVGLAGALALVLGCGAGRNTPAQVIREKGLWKITSGEAPRLSSPALSGPVVPLTKKPAAEALPGAKTMTNSIGMKLILIAPGTFWMGGQLEAPLHEVTISRPFYLGATEVTQAQWEAVMGNNPSDFKGADLPVERVSWNHCNDFCNRLTEKEQAAGKVPKSARYRLPTEAEWEYACRADSTERFSFGDADVDLAQHAWYLLNSDLQTHPVGQKRPSAWGLFDMHGNVWEWCSDWYGPYPAGDQKDPVGPPNGLCRVLRGGSFINAPVGCRSACRNGVAPDFRLTGGGFRVVFVPGLQ